MPNACVEEIVRRRIPAVTQIWRSVSWKTSVLVFTWYKSFLFKVRREITMLHHIRRVIYIFISSMNTMKEDRERFFLQWSISPTSISMIIIGKLFRNLRRGWRRTTCQTHLIPTQSPQPFICTLPVTYSMPEPNKEHYLCIPLRQSSVLIC